MWQTVAAVAFGVIFIAALLVMAVFIPRPTSFQYTLFRIVLALAAAGFATVLTGMLDITLSNGVKAGGALGVFVVVYFFAPAVLQVQPRR